MDVTREEVNGLGKRISEVELLKPTVARNEKDIQKMFEELGKIPAQNQALTKDISESNQKLLMKIMFAMLIAIGTATWAIVTK